MPLAQFLLLSLLVYTAAIPLRKFYSFGTDAGDQILNGNVSILIGDDQLMVTNSTVHNLSDRCILIITQCACAALLIVH